MKGADFFAQFEGDEEEFYALTLLGEAGMIVWATQTRWVGFTESSPPRELRKPSKVFARLAKVWDDIGQAFVVVRSSEDMLRFMLQGGNALIEPDIFEAGFREFLEPAVAIPDGCYGFSDPSSYDEAAFKRVSTAKLRMKILSRDSRRCRICGRRPDDHLDLELHVHHIRPWSKGGITEENNLITLCNTCHNGLDPHYDFSLFKYTIPDGMKPKVQKLAEEHLKGIAEYRRIILSQEVGGI